MTTPIEKPKKIIIGICARSKKANGKPMKQILAKLIELYRELETIIFSEATIFHQPVEKWPICDVLISFYSDGFPLEKVAKYIKLRPIFCINDIEKQFDLLNRATTYETLKANGVPVPRHQVLYRNQKDKSSKTFESALKGILGETFSDGIVNEFEDHIVVNGETFTKPFVEKPLSSEDHNIRIYYPPSSGGGSQKLFRKVENKCSSYSLDNTIRKYDSFIYEEFLQTNGTDVKCILSLHVYAVGPDYAHAEARKSPALDGRVNRDIEGTEVRYPVILSQTEKLIARKVVLAFKQTVCGFDLLRTDGKSYVCDVNGFSFVKKSTKYYEDAAQILGYLILRKMRPSEANYQLEYAVADKRPFVSTTGGKMMDLRLVFAVIRHGDRTPKQKLKMEVRDKRFLALFVKYSPKKTKIKLKRPNELQAVLDVARLVLKDITEKCGEIFEDSLRLEQLKMALELYAFTGINRKVQFRYESSDDDDGGGKLLLIVKWGGELTDAGKLQAEYLGKAFQALYSIDKHNDITSTGIGFLRLHSTYRHDLKIYASDEGRVKMTAAAFTKGLLALEGELPPILMQMVESDNMEPILGDDKDERQYQTTAKNLIRHYMGLDRTLTNDDMKALNPTEDIAIKKALLVIKNPKKMCEKLSNLMEVFCNLIEQKFDKQDDKKSNGTKLYSDETWSLVHSRWEKLAKDFKSMDDHDNVQYDVMKIPDIYDSIKYDMEHNAGALSIAQMQDIFTASKLLADVVVPQRFGITKEDKLFIGQQICTPLVKKLSSNFKRCLDGGQDETATRLDPNATKEVNDPFRHIRSRIYFTSESHIHPLMNLIRFDLLSQIKDPQYERALNFLSHITEFNYMSQVIFMLYEDTSKDFQLASRFHIEIHFTPGAMTYFQTKHVPDLGYRPQHLLFDSLPKSSNSDDKKPNNSKIKKDASLSDKISMENYTKDLDKVYQLQDATQADDVDFVNQSYSVGSESASPPDVHLMSVDDSSYQWYTATSPLDSEKTMIYDKTPPTSSTSSESWLNNFFRHTVNFCKRQSNKFLSDKVISDSRASSMEDKPLGAPGVMTTAIVGYGSRKLQTQDNSASDITRSVRFFVPPVRSLETLHNQITIQQMINFIDHIIYDKISPPGRN